MIKLFSAPWCTQCGVVKKVAAGMGNVVVLDISKSDHMQEYKELGVRGIPAVYSEQDGVLLVGADKCVDYLKTVKEGQ